jgi:hypothetical protein
MLVPAFRTGASAEENQMKRIFAILAVVTVAAGATVTTATANNHHRGHHHHWSVGLRSSNAELRGNNANSARGSNSLANPNNAAGSH